MVLWYVASSFGVGAQYSVSRHFSPLILGDIGALRAQLCKMNSYEGTKVVDILHKAAIGDCGTKTSSLKTVKLVINSTPFGPEKQWPKLPTRQGTHGKPSTRLIHL